MVVKQQYRAKLDCAPDFQELSTNTLNAIEQIAKVYRLETGDLLYRQGETAYSFYIVQRGGVRLLNYSTEGKKVNLKVYGPGDIFGLLAVSGPYKHDNEVQALYDSEIISINGEDARQLMQTHPQFAITIIDLLVDHVHHAHHRLRQMAVERVERRLARALLLFGDKFGKCGEGHSISIDIPLSQQDMAEYVSTSVETVNRILKQWQDLGYVSRYRKRIDVLETDALSMIAEDHVMQH